LVGCSAFAMWHVVTPAVKQRPQFRVGFGALVALLDCRRPGMPLAPIPGPLRVPGDGPHRTLSTAVGPGAPLARAATPLAEAAVDGLVLSVHIHRIRPSGGEQKRALGARWRRTCEVCRRPRIKPHTPSPEGGEWAILPAKTPL
jgi:hypothetical protein